eukprot:TRINITY_DN9198_c0_g1_i1.p1 TRINITY_DN9198_c0_g1~~TRINITY_DN9198_c0_g1_i1.p1  ORF type:complete len:171 (+),score=27.84 TRINITY_DN9198_c0_g1_i1:51-515(+)
MHDAPPGAPYDWWRDSNARYLGYVNELGEAYRPLIPIQAVWGSYVIAIGYAAGDSIDKTRNELTNGSSTKKAFAVGGCAALWQLLASVTLPAFFVNKQVASTSFLIKKYRPQASPSMVKFAPTLSGLAVIPFLPYVLDPPITFAVDKLESVLLA